MSGNIKTNEPVFENSDFIEVKNNTDVKRYFSKFSMLIGLLSSISETEKGSRKVNYETEIIIDELRKIANSFNALAMKYKFMGIVDDNKFAKNLEIDTTDSGFPVFHEIISMENDQQDAQHKFAEYPDYNELKKEMLDFMLRYKQAPSDLQYKMSQKHYYDLLIERRMFKAFNKPSIVPIDQAENGHHRYLIHWSTYDSAKNIPIIYIMIVEDSSKKRLLEDRGEIKKLEILLKTQSLSTMKLLTIAMNLDEDFHNLHPKSLKRVYVGPMYSNHFTQHNDHIQDILSKAKKGKDWVFSWTVETLLSKGTQNVKKGLFGEKLQEIFYVDQHDHNSFENGSSDTERLMILPYDAYQRLSEDPTNPLNGIYKYVIGEDGQILEL